MSKHRTPFQPMSDAKVLFIAISIFSLLLIAAGVAR